MVPTSMRSAADGVDDTSVRFLLKMALKTPEQVERPRRKEEAKEEEEEEVKHGLNADGCSSSQMRRKKEEEKETLEVDWFSLLAPACSAGACGKQCSRPSRQLWR